MIVEEVLINNINTENYSYVKSFIEDYYPRIVLKKDLPSYLINKVLKDIELLQLRQTNSLKINSPKVGDFVLYNDVYYRLGTKYPSGRFQVTNGNKCGYYMFNDGHCSYSGGFEWPENYESLNISKLVLTNELRTGEIWFFSNEDVKGHNGVYFSMDFKVWKQ